MLPTGPYNHTDHEQRILKWWLENGYYKPEYNSDSDKLMSEEEFHNDARLKTQNSKLKTWSLICPPPNAYGRPHIGNISGYAYMDAMARYQRMLGKKVLVIPGKDHAGLEGEGVFVREVLEKQGRKKFEMKREDFYAEMMAWMNENMKKAMQDEQEIGLSADFDRNIFTLDQRIVDQVLDTFVEMYNKKMIYKGVRIVNWDPKARSAVADNQTEYIETKTPFFYFKYSLGDADAKAIELKNKFEGKETLWRVKESKKDSSYILGERHDGVKVLGIAYDKVPSGNEVNGTIIGILMRLDGDYRLVVQGIDFDGNIDDEILKVSKEIYKDAAGSHIITFEDHKEDKYYTNGLIIGTVRPETIFADTAIACDPKDERYKEFIGKPLEVEFLGKKKKLNFIADYAVDKDFGTGLLKITPAHSVEDWEIAQRHKTECLPPIQVIGYDLRLNKLCGEDYAGLNIKEAREKIKTDMKDHGNLVLIDENYENKIKIAERTKAPIEPLLSSQWYLNYDVPVGEGKLSMREAAVAMVKKSSKLDVLSNKSETQNSKLKTQNSGLQPVTIHPESQESAFSHWMENLRDWAISRSLWWGYRLPVWYAGEVKEEIDDNGQVVELIKNSNVSNSKLEIRNSEEWVALEYTNPNHIRVQKESPGEGWTQDESVLDTWFSSGQWVHSTLKAFDLYDAFYPSQVMVSGFDILQNWISRMMMFSYFSTDMSPFEDVYLTGLVQGTDGQKMSKSRGNIISMDEVRQKYGTDAVRMSFFYQNSAGASYPITFEKLTMFKSFNNKIWNASKFILMNTSKNTIYDIRYTKLEFSKKALEHIKEVKERVTRNIESFDFGIATFNLYNEFWHTYCDILIEESKPYILPKLDKETKAVISEPAKEEKEEASQVMLYVLKEYLKMMHPFIPFITQAIWDEMPKSGDEHKVLMYTKW